jgi:hypothetical protein
MRFKLISCEVFYREMCSAVAHSPNQVDVEFVPRSLHDCAGPMRQTLQQMIDALDHTRYDAILLGYGLCGTGIAGLIARKIPIVIPRAHDCITLFLGSKERYADYFQKNPGVYFLTTGWLERGENNVTVNQLPLNYSYAKLVAKYGREKADYLSQELGRYQTHYTQFSFIEMGLEPNDGFERKTLQEASRRGWKFEKIRGDMKLIRRLLDGDWAEQDFLVVSPGHRVIAQYDEGILGTEPAEA